MTFAANFASKIVELVLVAIPAEIPAPETTANVAGLASPVGLLKTSLVDRWAPFLVVQITNQTLALHMVQEFRVDGETAEAFVAAGGQDGDIVGVVDGAAITSNGSVLLDQASSRGTSDGVSKGAKRRDGLVDYA